MFDAQECIGDFLAAVQPPTARRRAAVGRGRADGAAVASASTAQDLKTQAHVVSGSRRVDPSLSPASDVARARLGLRETPQAVGAPPSSSPLASIKHALNFPLPLNVPATFVLSIQLRRSLPLPLPVAAPRSHRLCLLQHRVVPVQLVRCAIEWGSCVVWVHVRWDGRRFWNPFKACCDG